MIARLQSLLKRSKKKIITTLTALSKEQRLVIFFVLLFVIVLGKLFNLQIVNWSEYTQKLIDQHYTKSSLEAERWHVFVTDKSWETLKMTENIDLYTLFVDPKFVWNKDKLLADLTPLLFDHFCVLYELVEPSPRQCIENLQWFIKQKILPDQPQVFYTTWSTIATGTLSQIADDIYIDIDYDAELAEIYEYYTPEIISNVIKKRLDAMIQPWLRERNYIWYYDDPADIAVIQEWWLESVELLDGYLYINPSRVVNPSREAEVISEILAVLWDTIDEETLKKRYLVPQENRYVQIVSGLNVKYVDRIQKIKDLYRERRFEESRNKWLYSRWIRAIARWDYDLVSTSILSIEKKNEVIEKRKNDEIYTISESDIRPEISALVQVEIPDFPVFHWVGLEPYQKRYYPHGTFMSHIVWYLDTAWQSYYGIEEYFDKQLRGKDGKIVWLATPWVWQVGSNNVVVEQPEDGVDVYLTIDPVVQKELESTVQKYLWVLRADSIAVTIIDPETWHVRAMANAPDFDPNNYVQAYDMQALWPNDKYLISDDSRVDIPLFIYTGGNLVQANTAQRQDLTTEKYFFKNFLWPQVFVDKNISFPYEPGSVFKALTLGIGIDSDSLGLYDFYFDPWFVKIGIYEIANIANACKWSHTYEHALAYSCNVGMVRIAQKIYKYMFYDYLDKLWFGRATGIELGQEDGGTLPNYNSVSFARYFNNTFGQWLLATPLQMAVWYSALLNGGWYIEPSIVDSIYDPNQERFLDLSETRKQKIFKTKTSLDMKNALVNVIDNGGLKEIKKPWFSLAGKTWTSELTFKWWYRWGLWWTNGSFVWAVTAKETDYVIAIQVRRPRSSERWLDTAGTIYADLADFLIWYEQIEE